MTPSPSEGAEAAASTLPGDDLAAGLPRPGDVIDGRLRILRPLGGGAMGVLYEAEQVPLGRRVAVKFVRPGASASGEAHARFLREARAGAAVRHRNVVEVFDLGVCRGVPWLVMPLLKGEALGARLEREGRIDVRAALEVLAGALEGLHAAHLGGVVHRDVKPDNIFLEATAEGEVPRVIDFGVARLCADDAPMRTRAGVLLGTPAYMAPEQVRGDAEVGPAADIYSVGATLFHLVTGQEPFRAPTLPALCVAILGGAREALSVRCPEAPPALEEIVQRALARDPRARYATALEFAQALRALAQGVAAPEPSAPARVTPRSSARRWTWVPPLLGLALCLATLPGILRRQAPAAPQPVPLQGTPSVREAPAPPASASPVSAPAPVAPGAPGVVVSPPTPGRPTAPARPVATPRDAGTAATFRLLVRTEDGAEVYLPGTQRGGTATIRRPGENARVELQAPLGASRVCCRIPHELDPVCVPITVEEGEGRARCVAH